MTNQFRHTHYDALIIGARCAGAATGMLLARNGARVLIVDRDTGMHDALSTHALMRPAVSLLHEWGVLQEVIEGGTPLVRRTQFIYGDERVDVPIKPDGSVQGLYAPRRWLLDRILRQTTVEAGAEFHTGTRFMSLIKNPTGRVTGAMLRRTDGSEVAVSATLVIGADGRSSQVADAAGARVLAQSKDRSATVYTYVGDVANEGYRWYFGEDCAAGLIPTTDGLHCLFTSCAPGAFAGRFGRDVFLGATRMLSLWEPGLAEDLMRSGPAERLRRYPGAPGHIRDCAGPGWALVGDAGYFKDPATAHGITDAFLDASRLARAFSINPTDVSAYQRERDQFAPRLFSLTQRIASLEWSFDTLKSLHMELNTCMKAEHATLGSFPAHHSNAA